ncbi:nuclear transport factor 2-like protein [Agromyces humi]|uniref:hypothetical protein n=1 Tax=Agromyces humi TaxID=1766800 RepID=UPI00135CB67B|nr:hypothetical protein [Agromyces humi]
MSEPESVAVVRSFMQAFLEQDRARAEALMADDFVFTSPQTEGRPAGVRSREITSPSK